MKNNSLSIYFFPALLSSLVALTACDSGSFGSDVGDSEVVPPTARAQVLNGGTSGNVFREGSEVLLTGKDSEDADGPIIDYEWSQTGGPAVELIERASSTVSFTAPDVSASTELSFRLTVVDSVNETGDASVSVTVIPAQDADEFLSLDLRAEELTTGTFDSFKVVTALADGRATGAAPEAFTLSVKAYIVYPPRGSSEVSCSDDPAELPASFPGKTTSNCLAHMLSDLTPGALAGGGTGLTGAWPANAPVPAEQTTEDKVTAWWNPRYSFPIPRLDIADFNQQFVDSGQRDQMLEDYHVDEAKIFVAFELVASSTMQDFAELILTTADDQLISEAGESATMAALKLHADTWATFSNGGTGLPASGVLPLETILASIRGRESALTAGVYYRTVDPDGTRTTLNDWLQQAGFTSDGDGTLLPAAVEGTGEFSHAVYVNNYDLGFGRDMYMRKGPSGNLYSFVVNYPTLEAAIRQIDPIVTVVMEYSPLGDPAGPGDKFTKFFTYVGDGSGDELRVGSMNFDGRGERYTPGNCVVCHGGHKPPGVDELVPVPGCTDAASPECYSWPAVNRDLDPIENGNLRATFLPWDLESFLYADTDPAITDAPVRFDGTTVADDLLDEFGDFSRASQEQQLQRLNEAVYSTYCDIDTAVEPETCKTDAARRLIEHWYDVEDGVFTSAFDDSDAPEGWRAGDLVDTPTTENPGLQTVNPPQAEVVYQLVYAQHCRMCHTNITEDSSRFDTYQKFTGEASTKRQAIERTVFRDGIMPAARLTADRFWTVNKLDSSDRSAAEVLAEELGIEPLGPAPTAEISADTLLIDRGGPVFLSAAGSNFANTFNWVVEYTPPQEVTDNPNRNPVFDTFSPTIIGAASEEMSFLAELPGTYDVTLTINEVSGPVSDTQRIDVKNNLPKPFPLSLTVREGESATLIVEERLTTSCGGGRCVEIFGDAKAEISVDDRNWDDAENGPLTVIDQETGEINVSPTRLGPFSGEISYILTDTDGDSARAPITVEIISLPNPRADDDPINPVQPQTTIDTQNADCTNTTPQIIGRELKVLLNDFVADGAEPLAVDTFTNPSPGNVSRSGRDLQFTPSLGFTGNYEFEYSVIDSRMRTSERLATVAIQVGPQVKFDPDVKNALGVVPNPTGDQCYFCHRTGGSGPGNWSMFSDVNARASGEAHEVCTQSDSILNPPSGTNAQHDNWTPSNGDFQTVWRWIEQGKAER